MAILLNTGCCKPGNRVLSAVGLTCLAAVMAFCVFYISSGYDSLVGWYTGLNDCFYRRENWASQFFTPAVKAMGNYHCAAGIAIASVYAFFLVRRMRSKKLRNEATVTTIGNYDLFAMTACIVAAVLLWWWGSSLVKASNDEVFSAFNCAGIHPFQTLSYYMLPNNHVFFNLVNNLVFHFCDDKVATGRVISLVCYLGLVPVLFLWLKSLIRPGWLLMCVMITVMLQFPVWGFSFQARGYELLTLAGWGAFVALYRYIATGEQKWLGILVVVCSVGYFTVPTFLYFHAAIVVFAFVGQMGKRRFDSLFWQYQLMCAGIVYLLYLPALCFSGHKAIAGNPYVKLDMGFSQLVSEALPMLQNYMDYCFCGFIRAGHEVDYVLFLLPLVLFFFRKNLAARFSAAFYVAMWGVVILLTIIMKVFPIDRALTVQFSITILFVIYTIYLLFGLFAEKVRSKLLWPSMMMLVLASFCYNYVQKGKAHAPHYLCHFSVNGWYDLLHNGLRAIPHGSSVSFSNESFYWKYLCMRGEYIVGDCQTGANYYIKADFEPISPTLANEYLPADTVAYFVIYKRK